MRASSVPSAGARVYVASVGEEEDLLYPVAHSTRCSGEMTLGKGQRHEGWASPSLEKWHTEIKEGHRDAGVGNVAVEAIHRPIDRKDHVEVAFESLCRGLAELRLEGKLDLNRLKFAL
jgi:hypothetical protein